jgi:AcrR family transcriptional regulator
MTAPNRQSQGDPRRLLPILASAFAQLGYRRATTAELARRCGVRENTLYRAWPSKKAMFLAVIEYVFDAARSIWEGLLAKGEPQHAAQRVLDYESVHHGELGLYRVVFAGLSETDDPEIRSSLRRMYLQFQKFIAAQVRSADTARSSPADPELIGWLLVGVGTVSNIARELGLLSAAQRRALFLEVGRAFLQGPKP